jgi:predicted metal-dependent HD superfamily phosphohydrolase
MNFFSMMWTISRLRRQWKDAHIFIAGGMRLEFSLILIQYTEDGRSYHTLNHILEGLKVIDRLCDQLGILPTDHNTLKFAFFYHDVVYNASAKKGENEQASVDFARDYLMHCMPVRFPVIEHLILMTADHQGADLPTDEHHDTVAKLWPIMSDADLAILGTKVSVYEKYAQKVWNEYRPFYERADFVKGRLAFLSGFMSRPIFKTRDMIVRYEKQALMNLQDEKDALLLEQMRAS